MSLSAGGTPVLVCAVCLFARSGPAPDAVSVINGIATCDDHLSLVALGGTFRQIIVTAGAPSRQPPRPAEE